MSHPTGLDAIKGLKPEKVWENFYKITQVPRPSRKEGKMQEFLIKFAKEHGLAVEKDTVGNIVINVPASHEKYKKSPVLALQGHQDMVCEKNPDKKIDFENDPITIYRDGSWIKAEGTSLGADNGLGVAMALTVAEDKSIEHGPLELLFTVDEETGLNGAKGLKPSAIKAKTMLNIDSEESDQLYVGCAGGTVIESEFALETEKNFFKKSYKIDLSGFLGGHSGCDIHLGRANAVKVLGDLLERLAAKFDYRAWEFNGGSAHNAIPRSASVRIATEADETAVRAEVDAFVKEVKSEFDGVEDVDKVKIVVEKEKSGALEYVYKGCFFARVLKVVSLIPAGVHAMCPKIKGTTETSSNLGVVKHCEHVLQVISSQRSFIEHAKARIVKATKSILKMGKATKIDDSASYPGWQPDVNSKVLKVMKEAFVQTYKKEPEVKAIHAGLECGILGEKLGGDCEMISFGPTIVSPHSPSERAKVDDVEGTFNVLKLVLKHYAQL